MRSFAGQQARQQGVCSAGSMLAAVGLIACLGLSPLAAGADGDGHHHDMPVGSNLGAEGPPIEGRQICSFRPGVHKAALCGTKAEIRPAPPLRGKMLMFEANSFTGQTPTEAQSKAADQMVAACEASAKRNGWEKLENALAAGYEPAYNDEIHFVNTKYIFDDALLDCDRPEYLMYYDTPSGKTLAGIMFVTKQLEDEGPQFGGALTRWHFHYWAMPRCMLDGAIAIGLATYGDCEKGELSFRSPEMLHVWLFDHPSGRFSSMMHLDAATIEELARQKAPSGGAAAAP